ncbi:hypothetical protein F0562_022117 [Nyssa sinensis]|uniref:Uncharacterized protein n=1 Tax=Nyssa sinensis TaxID=561372 RepID=A0A5J5BLV0_9ASTE|nr:hypothetical protein F0562_022117 [Nyssa sinensis]
MSAGLNMGDSGLAKHSFIPVTVWKNDSNFGFGEKISATFMFDTTCKQNFHVRFFWRILLSRLGIGLLLTQDKLLKLLIGFSRATTSVQSGLSI